MNSTGLRTGGRRAAVLAAVYLAELVVLAAAYQFLAVIECQATAAAQGCDLLRSMVVRALVVLAAATVFAWSRPQSVAGFLQAGPGARGWATVHALGVVLLFVPLGLTWGQDLSSQFARMAGFWLAGGALAAAGGLMWLAPPVAWRQLLASDRYAPVPVLVIAALLPDLAEAARPLWDWQDLTRLTFNAVDGFLSVFSNSNYSDPPAYVIGVSSFAVHIARQCSGVEGFALVTGFTLLYAFIFRNELRTGRFLLVVLPLGILFSWSLNVVRIGTLILIGAYVSPDLAVNGFHSYAGWLFFILLALGIVALGQAVPWFWRVSGPASPPMPVRSDPVAAAILPFVAFMLAGTAIRALLPVPAMGDPVVALVLAAACVAFAPALRQLTWVCDPVGITAGVAVGVGWVLLAEPTEASGTLAMALSGLGAGAYALWIALRFVGTTVLVPVVEELFFRGYLMSRVAGLRPGLPMQIVAVIVTSTLFAALHGRWAEGLVAGAVFALAALRRGRITDAIQAHVAANLIVALAALVRGDWTLV